MTKVFAFFFLLMFTLALQAQQIAVKSFRQLENDLDARAHYPKEDKNGEKAAIIKIVTTETGFEFDAGSIGIVASVQKTSEIWLYVPRGSKIVTIKHPKLGLLRNYAYPQSIGAGEVYEMMLVTGKVITTIEAPTIETQWLIITTDPADADVYINDQPAGKTPYQNELPTGKYTWRVSKELYLPDAGVSNLNTGSEKQVMNVKMKPNFGTLAMRTEPEVNGEVYINEMPVGKTTPCTIEMVPAGEKTIKVRKEMYQISEQRVILNPGQNLPVVFPANPTFGTLSLSSSPESGAFVSLNGTGTGKTTPCNIDKIPAGEHSITLSRDMYETTTQRVTLSAGENKQLTINMNPTFAEVTVTSGPVADIYINGQMKTKGTWLGRLYPGVYTFEAKLDKHLTATEKKTVIVGQPLNVNLLPTPITGNLKIITTPFDATIKIDGKELGKTPLTLKDQLIGDYTVELSMTGYATSYEKVTITEGVTAQINSTLQNGMLVEITSIPSGADLFIDDKPTGKTPYNGNMSFGSHKLRVESNGKRAEKQVLISLGSAVKFSLAITSATLQTEYSETTSGLNIEMIFVQGGTFQMGNNSGVDNEKPVHAVTLSAFFIGKTEVTQKQWRDVMGNDPSSFKNCDDCPVENVSWNDVQGFIKKLNKATAKNYRLPTEAEWEYAARGGNKSKGFAYSGSNVVGDVAWSTENSGSRTHAVGQKQSNELGLFDMSGNVWEWCKDWYAWDYYSSSQSSDPQGPLTGTYRVNRGGSWYSTTRRCLSANRDGGSVSRNNDLGFRLVLVQ